MLFFQMSDIPSNHKGFQTTNPYLEYQKNHFSTLQALEKNAFWMLSYLAITFGIFSTVVDMPIQPL